MIRFSSEDSTFTCRITKSIYPRMTHTSARRLPSSALEGKAKQALCLFLASVPQATPLCIVYDDYWALGAHLASSNPDLYFDSGKHLFGVFDVFQGLVTEIRVI